MTIVLKHTEEKMVDRALWTRVYRLLQESKSMYSMVPEGEIGKEYE